MLVLKGDETVELTKQSVTSSLEYVKAFLKWIVIGVVVGVAGGVVGCAFHQSVEWVTHIRENHSYVIYFLPIGGILIALFYRLFRAKGIIDTNRVMESVRKDEKVPLVMMPLIFISTVITHFLGGSAGREGAALQLGGSIGYNLGKVFRLNHNDSHIIVMAGMSAVFSALFGTPLTAAFFALEVIRVGVLCYAGLVPCIFSSIVAYQTSLLFGAEPVRFTTIAFPQISVDVMAKVVLLAIFCASLSIVFCFAIKKSDRCMEKIFKNVYVRAFVGGAVIVLLTLIVGSYDYNGAGMRVIARALSGSARPEAFVLKILFTAITISAGFKGGEIVPTFFIGATFGCVAGPLFGLDAAFSAAIGFIALFCGVVNCPIASLLLAFEVFGGEGMLFFAVVCAVSYMMSGYSGLYKSQKIVYSKLSDEKINIHAK